MADEDRTIIGAIVLGLKCALVSTLVVSLASCTAGTLWAFLNDSNLGPIVGVVFAFYTLPLSWLPGALAAPWLERETRRRG
jgi:hypothetical protein